MSKYVDLTDRIVRDDLMERAPGISYVRDTLEWLDRNPDQVPGRTITESESKDLFNTARQGLRYWPDALERAGIAVAPDPEPTNAEKLETDIRALLQEPSQSFSIARDLAEKLDTAGWVKEPSREADE